MLPAPANSAPQVRLDLELNDLTRAFITQRRIGKKTLALDDNKDLRLKYEALMQQYYSRHGDVEELAESHLASWRAGAPVSALALSAAHACMAPFAPSQQDLLARLAALPELADAHGNAKGLVAAFQDTQVVLAADAQAQWGALVAEAAGADAWEGKFAPALHAHNVRVLARYYTSASLARLARLLVLSRDALEAAIADQVTAGHVYARINRPGGTVVFGKPATPADTLNTWAEGLSGLVSKVELATHKARKELIK